MDSSDIVHEKSMNRWADSNRKPYWLVLVPVVGLIAGVGVYVLLSWLAFVTLDRPMKLFTPKDTMLTLLSCALVIASIISMVSVKKWNAKKVLTASAIFFSIFTLLVVIFVTKEWDKLTLLTNLTLWLIFSLGGALFCFVLNQVLGRKNLT